MRIKADTCNQHTAGEGGDSLLHSLQSHDQTSGETLHVPSVRSFADDKHKALAQVLGAHPPISAMPEPIWSEHPQGTRNAPV